MGYTDWIFIGVLLVVIIVGALLGFGKGLKFITGGPVGVIISIVLCYCFGGMILHIPFVQNMLVDLSAHWSHISILNTIHLEIIIYYIALFLIVTLLRIIIVRLLKNLVESDILIMRIFNKIGGALLFTALAFLVMFLVFQIIQWIGGGTAQQFERQLQMNGCILNWLYLHNPMAGLVEMVKGIFVPEQTAFIF